MSYQTKAEAKETAPRPRDVVVPTASDDSSKSTRGRHTPPERIWEERETDSLAPVKIALAFLFPLLALMAWAAFGG